MKTLRSSLRGGPPLGLCLALALLWFVLTALTPPQALAGSSASGELAFYPCDRCHPVELGSDGKPTKRLPIGLKKHEIKLEVHDVLGNTHAACLVCHDSPQKNPGMLRLPDGRLVDVAGDTSRVCQRCHFEKYSEFKAGIHGKNAEKCSASGCHDPHSPSWIYVRALPPYQGTGVLVNAVGSDREPFKPFASPPNYAPVQTPRWLWFATAFFGATALGGLGLVMRRRSPR